MSLGSKGEYLKCCRENDGEMVIRMERERRSKRWGKHAMKGEKIE
jgi:hypothetical protein